VLLWCLTLWCNYEELTLYVSLCYNFLLEFCDVGMFIRGG
jgi:hypothetical protein